MSPLELVDDRFEQLARELRATRPVASSALRERVRALEPPPSPRREVSLRRLGPRVAAAAVAAALGVALAIGVVHGLSKGSGTLQGRKEVFGQAMTVKHGAAPSAAENNALQASGAARLRNGGIPSARDRLQQYDSVLTLRVDNRADLSARTSQAMRLTRALGGYVASAVYNVPGRRGMSALILRIPIDQVQRALDAFSAYGTLVAQRVSVKDVQRRVDDITSSLGVLHKDIAKIDQELAGVLTPERRAELQQRLAADRRHVDALTTAKQALTRRAQLARVVLTLVTPRQHAAAAKGRIDRTLDDAGGVLARELQILLYALVVVGPLLALGAAGVAVGRAQRRRSDRRLLERA